MAFPYIPSVMFQFFYFQTKLFPDVDPDYVKRLLQENHGSQAVNNVCFALLESKTPYPKLKKTEKTTPKVQPVEVSNVLLFSHF